MWNIVLNNTLITEITKHGINHLLLSIKCHSHNTFFLGCIQCLSNMGFTKKIIHIIGSSNIGQWENVNIFKHLTICDTMIHLIVLHDEEMYREDSHLTNTAKNTIIEFGNFLPLNT